MSTAINILDGLAVGRTGLTLPALRKLWRRMRDRLAGYQEEELPF